MAIYRGAVLAAALMLAIGCAPDPGPRARSPDLAPAHACGDELKRTGRVVDAANILPAPLRARVARRLAAWEARTGHQFVVVTTPSLSGSDIALYSLRLFRRWGIGRRGANDGIGLLVAPNDRRMRIEVGYGLERALPDDLAAKIIRDRAMPAFRAGNLPSGIEATVAAVIDAIDASQSKPAASPH